MKLPEYQPLTTQLQIGEGCGIPGRSWWRTRYHLNLEVIALRKVCRVLESALVDEGAIEIVLLAYRGSPSPFQCGIVGLHLIQSGTALAIQLGHFCGIKKLLDVSYAELTKTGI